MIKKEYRKPHMRLFECLLKDGLLDYTSGGEEKEDPDDDVKRESAISNGEDSSGSSRVWDNAWSLLLLPLLSCLLGLTSCSDDAINSGNGSLMVTMGMPGYEITDEIYCDDTDETKQAPIHRRLKYIVHGGSAKVVWGGPTTIGIFPVNPVNSQIHFSFEPKTDDNKAYFSGQGWGLQEGVTYAAYYPYHNLSSNDRYDSIPVSFRGQHQVGNNSFDHIGNHYDYMYTDETRVENGQCTFHFKHANTLLQFRVIPPVAAEWESLTVSTQAGEEVFVDSCSMNVLTGEVKPIKKSSAFTITLSDLKNKAVGDTLYINSTQLPTSVPPITICLRSVDGNCFYSNFSSKAKVQWIAGQMKVYTLSPKTSNMLNVDLGLPSKKLWATSNLGALMPYESGLYLAWGEKQSRETYYWTTYAYSRISDSEYASNNTHLTRYTIDDGYTWGNWYNANGTFQGDNQRTLLDEDDPAHLLWGGKWSSPTREDYEELLQYTTSEWVETEMGFAGYRLTSKVNNNTIFFPAAGWCGRKVLDEPDEGPMGLNRMGYYWTRSLSPDYSFDAIEFKFGVQYTDKDTLFMQPSLTPAKRYLGCSVRAIRPGK